MLLSVAVMHDTRPQHKQSMMSPRRAVLPRRTLGPVDYWRVSCFEDCWKMLRLREGRHLEAIQRRANVVGSLPLLGRHHRAAEQSLAQARLAFEMLLSAAVISTQTASSAQAIGAAHTAWYRRRIVSPRRAPGPIDR